ncbi:prolipoprotein diacylglyceryl transferase [Chitinophaga sp. Hz27]|uniref:prolipoprotein diacylglyceryl transferase n=1 Tax=Chitinophaga sp. Hz27 TaxID=3347169 RepID=UPI0035D873C5
MYPNLYYAFKDLLGLEIPFFKLFQTFGFFVAIAFLAAAYVLTQELKRREKLGWMKGVQEKVLIGQPVSYAEIIVNGIVGFLLGLKIVGLMLDWDNAMQDFQGYMMSSQGSMAAAILGAILFAGYKIYKRQKTLKNTQHKEEVVTIMPHQRVPDFTVMAAIAGLIGAKIFHNLENWNDFIADPVGALISFSGLTFYGGLIVAAVVIINYAKKKKINIRHLIDSAAPALMLAYGIGRMGCHFAGDGDWGIYNSAYATDNLGKVVKVAPAQFAEEVQKNAAFFVPQYGSIENIPHAAFEKPAALGFLPDWFFGYGYPHNVVKEGVQMANCDGQYCKVLPIAVYPTPLYEIIACIGLFLVLWAIRKRVTVPGVIFGIYLVLNGVERFFIEKIRVNTKYNIFGFHPTQAEIISALMVLGGLGLIWYCNKNKSTETAAS